MGLSDAEKEAQSLRENLGVDGHLLENVASWIAAMAAKVRSQYGDLAYANIALADAVAAAADGKYRPKISQVVADAGKRIWVLQIRVLKPAERQIVSAAQDAGLCTSINQARELEEALQEKDMAALREVALKLGVPSKDKNPNEWPTLKSVIQALPGQN